jgi:hypothetical protein
MWTGVQWTGTLAANASGRWFTFNWPTDWQVVWYMMPTTVQNGVPAVDWDVSVERADDTHCTYWITVKNLSASSINFEGRYAVLNN